MAKVAAKKPAAKKVAAPKAKTAATKAAPKAKAVVKVRMEPVVKYVGTSACPVQATMLSRAD